MDLKLLAEAIKSLAEFGCTDGYCDFRGLAKGMHTNGGCKCLYEIRNPHIRVRIRRILREARNLE